MVEDKDFNAFLKEKLEEDLVIPEVRLPVARPPVRWWKPLFLAASLAVMLGGLVFWQSRLSSRACGADRPFDALDLFEACEGTVALSDNAENSFAERLLAWQDAPFEEVAGL